MVDMLAIAGLTPVQAFPGKPTLYWRTRCNRCGAVADYRLVYVIEKNASGEQTCRVCFWMEWAATADRTARRMSEVIPYDDIRTLAAENDYDLTELVRPQTRFNQPVVLRCRHCNKLKVSRVLDIHWGCECRQAKRRAEKEAAKLRRKSSRPGYIEPPPVTGIAQPLADSGLPAVAWWDHERNPETLFQNVFPSAKRVVAWVGPSCGHRFDRAVAAMAGEPACPICGASS